MIRAFLHWLLGADPDVLPHWTPERGKQLERETLEALGMKGFHFGWHREHLKEKRKKLHSHWSMEARRKSA